MEPPGGRLYGQGKDRVPPLQHPGAPRPPTCSPSLVRRRSNFLRDAGRTLKAFGIYLIAPLPLSYSDVS